MKLSIAVLFLILIIGGCNKGTGTQEARMANGKPLPGYDEAKLICTQCHALSDPGQFHPAAWPSVVKRMESHIRANNKILPNEEQRAAILGYLQNSGR